MFSQTADYAFRAAVHLADQSPNAQTTEQIAEVTRVPAAYLSKVLQSLTRAGLLHSQRGVKGGFSLARNPHQLTILDVVEAGIPSVERKPFRSSFPLERNTSIRFIDDSIERSPWSRKSLEKPHSPRLSMNRRKVFQ